MLAAAITGGALWRLYQRATFGYDGLRYRGPDIGPITPNDRFYVVPKNVIDPRIVPSIWRLAVTGLVRRPTPGTGNFIWTALLADKPAPLAACFLRKAQVAARSLGGRCTSLRQ